MQVSCLILPFLVMTPLLYSQTGISGVINDYSAVLTVEADDKSVTVANPEYFQPGDTVLLIQMKGMSIIISDDPEQFGRQQDVNSSGHYEFLLVDDVTGNTIIFTRELLKEYNADETVQLVRVRGYESVTVEGTLGARQWDGETGGVVALIVTNTLTLEANIDVSERGFRGGQPVTLSDDQCSEDTPEYRKLYFGEGEPMAGEKGEGPVSYYREDEVIYPVGDGFVYGYGRMATGGGGGNGRFSGGGGGSNFGIGGYGGNESEECESWMNGDNQLGGVVGNSLTNQLFDAAGDFLDRLYMGGGGGGSTQYGTRHATPAGNGGGIAIIIANYIESPGGFGIYADGGSVSESATAGAGGGGGGGTIVASIDNYAGNIGFYARGGKGGNIDYETRSGPGGGGGGGAIIHSETDLPGHIVPAFTAYGSGTNLQQNDPYGTTSPVDGGVIQGLEIALNGLLFNGIRTERYVICEETVPEIIEGTQPRGGGSPYSFKWLSRPVGTDDWSNIEGAGAMDYQPDALFQTTEFMRVVEDTSFPAVIDSSNILTIDVQPKITGNFISEEQWICEGETPETLNGAPLTEGGTTVFEYQWNRSAATGGQWTEAAGESNEITYSPPPLYDSTRYVRIALSGECTDTSNIIPVNVHPSIVNNILDADQTICLGDTPQTISAPVQLSGGEGAGSWSFAWEAGTNGTWSPVDEDGSEETFSPESLTDTMSYRRTVISGACKDTSPPHTVTVLPLITGNTISGDQTICLLVAAELYPQSEPGGGDGSYSYLWEASAGIDEWEIAEGETGNESYVSPSLQEELRFRRIVLSGEGDACKDTSNISQVDFFPPSVAGIIESNDSICIGEESDITFSLGGNGPWNLVFSDGNENFTIENIDQTLFTTTVSPSTNDSSLVTYSIVSLTDNFGCSATAENMTGEATVMVYAYPEPDAGAGGEVCGPVIRMDAMPGFGRGLWEVESVSASFDPGPQRHDATVTVEEYGTFTFRWTETNWQCPASSEVTVTFYEQPFDVYAGENQDLHYIFETSMNAVIPDRMVSATGHWELLDGSGTVVFPNDPGSPVTDLGLGENVFLWTLINGVCDPVSEMVTVRIKDLDAPTGFSPNNSGYNDRFVVRGLENSTTSELTIFNRQGNIVYRTVNYQNDWEGRNQSGIPLPEDTYYYILSVDNKYSYKGFIVLKR